MTLDKVQDNDINVQKIYNKCTRGINMIEVTISEFRNNIKKYQEMLKDDDILVMNNGKPVMKIQDPEKERWLEFKSLFGSLSEYDDGRDYDEVLKERVKDYEDLV